MTTHGDVLLPGSRAGSRAATLRVYEWMDLVAGRVVTAAELGAVTAQLHKVDHPATRPVEDWFARPIGADRWHAMLDVGLRAGLAWAASLRCWLPDLIAGRLGSQASTT
jgi:hypothetical protein